MTQAQRKVLEEALKLKIEKLATLYKEEIITANIKVKFEMKKHIAELEREIKEIEKKLGKNEDLESDNFENPNIQAENYIINQSGGVINIDQRKTND